MTERLGLFTIILFGETILGVINGTIELKTLNLHVWVIFSLVVLIIFSLWWIFFGTVADRESKKIRSNTKAAEMAYLPTLLFLGLTGAGFSTGFHEGGAKYCCKKYFGRNNLLEYL
jgi:low temperature requirement protein LtrA